MTKREKQLENNLNMIFGMYENGMYDDNYPQLSDEECIKYAKADVFDMLDNGYGTTDYGKGIADDLKFLGNDYIDKTILRIADECGVRKG